MPDGAIRDFLRPTKKKLFIFIAPYLLLLLILGGFFIYSMRTENTTADFWVIPVVPIVFLFEFLRQTILSPDAVFIEQVIVFASIFLGWYLFSCFVVMDDKRRRFFVYLRPDLLQIKLILFVVFVVSLILVLKNYPPHALVLYYLMGVGAYFPRMGSIRFMDLFFYFGFILLPLIFYLAAGRFKKTYDSSKRVQQFFEPDPLKALFSVFLCIIFSLVVYYFTPRYYFPFYYAQMGFLPFLIINLVLGSILLFPLAGLFVSFLRKRGVLQSIGPNPQFFRPNLNKILILLGLFLLSGYGISLSFVLNGYNSIFLSLFAAFLFMLFWYFVSCLVYARLHRIGRNSKLEPGPDMLPLQDKKETGVIPKHGYGFALILAVALVSAGAFLTNSGKEAQRVPVEFEFVNDLSTPFYVAGFGVPRIYTFEDGGWREVRISGGLRNGCGCVCVGCPIYQMDTIGRPRCKEIPPSGSMKFSWDQLETVETKRVCAGIFVKDCSGGVYVPAGRYKVEVCYAHSCNESYPDIASLKCIEQEFSLPSEDKVRLIAGNPEEQNKVLQ